MEGEEKLEKIEKEIDKYKKELEKAKEEETKKTEKIERKKRRQKHWDMMKWVVQFIDDNKERWDEMRRRKKEDRKQQELLEDWNKKTKEEKIEQLKHEF